MLRHSPLSAAATAGSNSSSNSISKTSNVGSSVKPVQHHLDRASLHFEGFIVDLMDRITNVRLWSIFVTPRRAFINTADKVMLLHRFVGSLVCLLI